MPLKLHEKREYEDIDQKLNILTFKLALEKYARKKSEEETASIGLWFYDKYKWIFFKKVRYIRVDYVMSTYNDSSFREEVINYILETANALLSPEIHHLEIRLRDYNNRLKYDHFMERRIYKWENGSIGDSYV